jgi:hypothetical protein
MPEEESMPSEFVEETVFLEEEHSEFQEETE